MTKLCVICWNTVTPDGCGFYCKNDNDLINLNPNGVTEFSWLGPYMVFDTETADTVENCLFKKTQQPLY